MYRTGILNRNSCTCWRSAHQPTVIADRGFLTGRKSNGRYLAGGRRAACAVLYALRGSFDISQAYMAEFRAEHAGPSLWRHARASHQLRGALPSLRPGAIGLIRTGDASCQRHPRFGRCDPNIEGWT
jgi:hypothetical protein